MPIVSRLLLIATCIVGCASASRTESAPVQFELPNGLQVILKPVAGAPHAAVVTLYAVGNRHDPPGASGLAHFLEHLYTVAATDNAPARTIDQFVRAYPLGWNAQTGDDYTVYATVVHNPELAAEIQRHADRMGSLKIAPADLQRELPRIDDELANMFERMPALAAVNLARETIRPTPHSGRRGGRIDELKNVTLEQLLSRWQQYYKPRNAILAVAGDFDSKTVRAQIESAFGKLPSGDNLPQPKKRSDARDVAPEPREVVSRNTAAPSQAALSFVVPGPDSPDYAPLLVFITRLMHSQSGVVEWLQSSARPSVQYALLDSPDVVSITVEAQPNESARDAEKHLRAFVAKAAGAAWQPHERELTRQSFAFMLDTAPLPDAALANNIYGVAFAAGRRHQLGLKGKNLANELDQVTAADLTRVVKQYISIADGACVLIRAPAP